ncbi:MAG: hypothetical protein M5R36_03645 [Deltaproteobacteria bacterium]|nr:hypothetical protein [Deltaproteobacteria bacterium]
MWANIHGSFILGVAMALIWCAEQWWESRGRAWFAWAAAMAAAPMLNPFGPRIYLFAEQIDEYKFFVSEWEKYSWDNPSMWVVSAVFALLTIDLIRVKKRRLFDAARLAVVGGLAATAMRHGSRPFFFSRRFWRSDTRRGCARCVRAFIRR